MRVSTFSFLERVLHSFFQTNRSNSLPNVSDRIVFALSFLFCEIVVWPIMQCNLMLLYLPFGCSCYAKLHYSSIAFSSGSHKEAPARWTFWFKYNLKSTNSICVTLLATRVTRRVKGHVCVLIIKGEGACWRV